MGRQHTAYSHIEIYTCMMLCPTVPVKVAIEYVPGWTEVVRGLVRSDHVAL